MKTKVYRLFAVLFIAAAVTVGANAQKQVFNVNDADLSLGMGFGSPVITTGRTGILPPTSVSLDYGLRDDWGPGVFGVGGYVSTSVYRWKTTWMNQTYGYTYTSFVIATRATYHYTFVDKLDTYGGALLGIRATIDSPYGDWPPGATADTDAGVEPVVGAFVGARYYFTKNFAAFNEIATSVAYFTIGLNWKF